MINSLFGYSQTSSSDPSDVQGWYGASCNLNLPKKWGATVGAQSRFVNNLKDYNVTYLSLGVNRKIDKHVDLMAEYRLGLLNTAVYNRYTIGTEFSNYKYKKFSFSLRLQLQNQLQEFDDTTKFDDNSGYWRVRVQGKYPVTNKLDAYAFWEPIMKFGGIYFIDNIRNTIGIKYKVLPDLKLDLYYIYRPDYAKSYNRLFHVIGFNADYSLKIKKKKSSKS